MYKRLTDIQTNHRDTGLGRGGSEGASVASTFVGRVGVHPSKETLSKTFPAHKGTPHMWTLGIQFTPFSAFFLHVGGRLS